MGHRVDNADSMGHRVDNADAMGHRVDNADAMGHKVDNAVIMAAGLSSRLTPLTDNCPKGLLKVRGEVLIERQITQIMEAGINEIIIVTGHMKERFAYLHEKFGATIIENASYKTRNNSSSIFAAREYIHNSYICSSDNYFLTNPFEPIVEESYYASVYEEGCTDEWCISADESDVIRDVSIGGRDSWVMMGHSFWDENFSSRFLSILTDIYDEPTTRDLYWENIYIDNINELKMKIRKYNKEEIREFDTVDDLRRFDPAYAVMS